MLPKNHEDLKVATYFIPLIHTNLGLNNGTNLEIEQTSINLLKPTDNICQKIINTGNHVGLDEARVQNNKMLFYK